MLKTLLCSFSITPRSHIIELVNAAFGLSDLFRNKSINQTLNGKVFTDPPMCHKGTRKTQLRELVESDSRDRGKNMDGTRIVENLGRSLE